MRVFNNIKNGTTLLSTGIKEKFITSRILL